MSIRRMLLDGVPSLLMLSAVPMTSWAQSATPYDGQWTGKYQCRGFSNDVLATVSRGQFYLRRYLSAGSEITTGTVSGDGQLKAVGKPDGSQIGKWTATFEGRFSGEQFIGSGTLRGKISNDCFLTLQRTPGTGPPNPSTNTLPNVPSTSPLASAPSIDVRTAQLALTKLGFYDSVVDGVAGPQTLAAIKNWQGKNGFPATGTLTFEEAQKLFQMAIVSSEPRNYPKSERPQGPTQLEN